jgi:hypothetical protein
MALRLSVLRAARHSTQGFVVLILVKRLSRSQGYSAAGGIRYIEKYSGTGNRTSDDSE